MLNERKKYSLRKYKVGLFSVLVGAGRSRASKTEHLLQKVEKWSDSVVSTHPS